MNTEFSTVTVFRVMTEHGLTHTALEFSLLYKAPRKIYIFKALKGFLLNTVPEVRLLSKHS